MEFYTLSEVMQILKSSNSAVMSLINHKKLKAQKVGRQWRIYKHNLEEFADMGEIQAFKRTVLVMQQKRGRKAS